MRLQKHLLYVSLPDSDREVKMAARVYMKARDGSEIKMEILGQTKMAGAYAAQGKDGAQSAEVELT